MEAAGGTVVHGYDAWLKLSPKGPLIPRFEDRYQQVDCAEPRAFFVNVLKSDELSRHGAVLTCSGYTDPRLHFDNGRWLVMDRTSGRVYFRVWKRP
ncbi:MAG: hypothetical protein WCA32_23765 [Chromatiaceae bacterium]